MTHEDERLGGGRTPKDTEPPRREANKARRAARGDQAVRRTMTARARCDETVTVIVEVYRQSVWLSVVPSFRSAAILDPAHVDSLVVTLIQAAQEARSHKA